VGVWGYDAAMSIVQDLIALAQRPGITTEEAAALKFAIATE
jgi:hypothetical protein